MKGIIEASVYLILFAFICMFSIDFIRINRDVSDAGEVSQYIENNPSDVMPYYGFLGEFGVIDIQAAVRMLYSIGELEQDSMSATINAIVRRNYELSDKAELTRYMDSTSMMRFSEYVPTFFVALKMAVDMMLVVTMYL